MVKYKIFGKIATLINNRKIPIEGGSIIIECIGAEVVRLRSNIRGDDYFEKLVDGKAIIPVEIIDGGVDVTFYLSDESDVWATPLKTQSLDNNIYIIGGSLSARESLERLEDQMVYVVETVERALEKAARVEEFEKRLERLEQRADSGDILK